MSASPDQFSTAPADPSSQPSAGPAMIHPLSLLKRFWLLVVIAIFAVGYGIHTFRYAFIDQGYAPSQPIAYSHKLHAGELKIDCKYCHFNAPRGRVAGVPPMSVCIGCHRQVATDKPEIQKLLAIADTGSYVDTDGVTKEGGVVHWNRVHRLPDHVYFSHEWHDKAAVACQTCHGPVEEMTTMRQYAPLTMEWCLDCHRNTNYVGGPHYDPSKPTSFAVGTGNYDAMRKQEEKNPVVTWAPRDLAGTKPDPAAVSDGHGRLPKTVAEIEPSFATTLKRIMTEHPEWRDLPTWRIADLPESHRKLYGSDDYMNAPTQCSTCHQ